VKALLVHPDDVVVEQGELRLFLDRKRLRQPSVNRDWGVECSHHPVVTIPIEFDSFVGDSLNFNDGERFE
jgi:hypothetical protein